MEVRDLPTGVVVPAMNFPHFQARFQAVIWRNWNLVSTTRLAKVLRASVEDIMREAGKLGLPPALKHCPEELWLRRGYMTLIRQNWHLLPYPQLLDLLGWTPDELDYALREDDFLWNKLGGFKPESAPVAVESLTSEQEERTEAIRDLAARRFSVWDGPPVKSPFAFLEDFAQQPPAHHPPPPVRSLRLAYSYAAVYGDPLLDPTLDPYPEGLLARLADNGVNAVWLQGVLYSLIPWLGEKHSQNHAMRIANLSDLTTKAGKYGIGVYLYLNEPRSMPMDLFEDHPDWKGASGRQACLCVSNPEVMEKFRWAVSELFREAPGLAGVFTITMSENLTHCLSHHGRPGLKDCPRCVGRSPAELVAAVNNAVAEAAHAVKPEADVIAWDWCWEPEWSERAIGLLRSDVKLMCTSETYLPTEAMGIKGLVADYSISKVGPGPLAEGNWACARRSGLETVAKVQLNNSWECAAVPYLPVPFLVKRHLRNLQELQVSGLMVSWTLGGYPGGNLRLIDKEPEELAVEWFGERAATEVVAAWREFSDAFAEFPLHSCACLYTGPQNYGPMNQLFPSPSGQRATMVGFPYDDLSSWRGGHFPEEVFEAQFRKLSEGWAHGLETLRQAAPLVPADRKEAMDDLLNVAEAAYCHFRCSYLQIRFIRLRDGGDQKTFALERNAILDEEIELAESLLSIVRRDSRVGFEASNHYFYTENSLKEKILNCEHLRQVFNNKT